MFKVRGQHDMVSNALHFLKKAADGCSLSQEREWNLHSWVFSLLTNNETLCSLDLVVRVESVLYPKGRLMSGPSLFLLIAPAAHDWAFSHHDCPILLIFWNSWKILILYTACTVVFGRIFLLCRCNMFVFVFIWTTVLIVYPKVSEKALCPSINALFKQLF